MPQVTHIVDALPALFEEVQAGKDRTLEGVSFTGLMDIDKLVQLEKNRSRLVIIAGRPSMGRSALAHQISLNVGKSRRALHFSSMEINVVLRRMVAQIRGLPMGQLSQQDLFDEDQSEFSIPVEVLRKRDITFAAIPAAKDTNFETTVRNVHWGFGPIDCTVFDGLLPTLEELQMLKTLSRELSHTIVVTTTLSSEVDSRVNNRHFLADLARGEETLADVVMLLSRPDYYARPPQGRDRSFDVWVAKNNGYATGFASLEFDEHSAAILDVKPVDGKDSPI